MKSLLLRANGRFFRHHPGQLGLAVLGIALGVAVVIAVDLARTSAQLSFERASQVVSGAASHRINGGPGGLPETLYTRLRVAHGFRPSAPKLEGHVKTPGADGISLRLLGIDPFAELELQPPWRADAPGPEADRLADFLPLLTRPGGFICSAATAARLGIRPGDPLEIQVGGRRQTLQLVTLWPARNRLDRQQLADLILTDIATAQETLGLLGRLSHIDLILDPSDRQRLQTLTGLLPPAAQLISQGAAGRSLRRLTAAFYTNLSALSLLSLVVGLFLIYNTITFLVVQRRRLIGSLRSLGVSRREIFALVLLEAGVLGLVGTALGILLGTVLGQGALRLIAVTLNDVYFSLSAPRLIITAPVLLKGSLLGTGAVLATAVAPALEATRVPPLHALSRSQQEARSRRLLLPSALAGLLVLAAGAGCIAWSGKSVSLGFAGLLAIVLGFALLTPLATVALMAALRPPLEKLFGIMGALPARTVSASLSRTGIAIAALMVAVATTTGMTLMVDSFRGSLSRWLENRLGADLYINPADSITPLEPVLLERIAAIPGIAASASVRRLSLESAAGPIRISAYRLPPAARQGFRFSQGRPETAWPAFERGAVLVSEPYAYHHGVEPGDRIQLPTDFGMRRFEVAGVYRDYNAGPGIIAMSRATYERHWRDRSHSGIWIYTRPGIDPETLKPVIQRASQGALLSFRTGRAYIEASLAVFDRAFVITEVLRWLAAAIAFIGVFSALMALQLERVREFGVLRALGLTPLELRLLIHAETGLMGLVAGLFSVPLGWVMAYLLIFVINRRSFGWSMEMSITAATLWQGIILALVAALLAGLYPARKMARTVPARALRSE